MGVSNTGVDAVFQMTTQYMRGIIEDALYENLDPCGLTTGPQQFGNMHLEADDLSFSFDVAFQYRQNQTYVDLRLNREDGQLKAGPSAGQLQPVNAVHLEYPIQIDTSATTGLKLVLKIPFDLPNQPALSIPLDLQLLNMNNVGTQLGSPAATVKLVNNDVIAVGLNCNTSEGSGPSVDFSSFHSSYSDNLFTRQTYRPSSIPNETDWAVEIDRWLIETIVEATDLSSASSKLRNTSVKLNSIDAANSKLKLTVSGDAKFVVWNPFTAKAWVKFFQGERGVSISTVDMFYKITSAESRGFDILNQVQNQGHERGQRRVIDHAYGGQQSDPAGHLFVLDVYPVTDGFVTRGAGTNTVSHPGKPTVEGDGAFAHACGSTQIDRDTTITIANEDDGLPRRDLTVCSVHIEGPDASHFTITQGRTQPFDLSSGNDATFDVRFTGTDARGYNAVLVVITSEGRREIPLRAYLANPSLTLGGEFSVTTERSCQAMLLDRVDLDVRISNAGPGAYKLCNVELSNISGGTWSLSGVEVHQPNPFYDRQVFMTQSGPNTWTPSGEALISDLSATLVLTIDVELNGQLSPNQSLTADLHIETTGRDFTKTLTVKEGEVSAGFGQFDDLFEGIGINSPYEFCAKAPDLPRLIEAWERIHEDLLDSIWDRSEGIDPPECCPEPIQPRCLCRNFYQICGRGMPQGARFSGRAGRGQGFQYDRLPANPCVIAPFDPEHPTEIELNGPENRLGEDSHPVVLKFKRWQASRRAVWEADAPIRGVVGLDERFAILNGDTISVVHAGKTPEIVHERTLDREMNDLSGIGGLLITSGNGDLAVLDAKSLEMRHFQPGTSYDSFVPIAMNRPGTVDGFGLGAETIARLEFTGEGWTNSRQAKLDIDPQFADWNGEHLIATGRERIRAFDGDLEPAWQYETRGISGLISMPGMTYLFTEDGRVEVLDTSSGKAYQMGTHHLGDDLYDAVPFGAVVSDGLRYAARHRANNQMNIYTLEPVQIAEQKEVEQTATQTTEASSR